MSLERLSSQGRLRKTPTSQGEISDLLAAAKRYLTDAQVEQVSLDSRYSLAYNAVLQTATALLRCHAYRTTGVGHHVTTFEALSAILGPREKGFVGYLDSCRSKRNRALYHQVGLVSEKELDELIEESERFIALATELIANEFPEYAPGP